MKDLFINSNKSTRYLYALRDVINVVYSSLSRYIRNLSKATIILSLI